jgi:hypothetical protein
MVRETVGNGNERAAPVWDKAHNSAREIIAIGHVFQDVAADHPKNIELANTREGLGKHQVAADVYSLGGKQVVVDDAKTAKFGRLENPLFDPRLDRFPEVPA